MSLFAPSFRSALITPTILTRPARFLGLSLVTAAILFAVAPWQQTAKGYGQIVAFAPMDRQQPIEAPIKGRLVRWYVVEGTHVKAGDPIAELKDIDPGYMARLERSLAAIKARYEAATEQEKAYGAQVAAYENVRTKVVEAARLKVAMAGQKLLAAHQKLEGEIAAQTAAQQNLERKRRLVEEGLSSQRDLELAQMYAIQANAKVNGAKAAVLEAEARQTANRAEQMQKDSESLAKIASAEASRRKARADEAKAQDELAKMETKLARQASQIVTAPRTGTVLRLSGDQGGAVVKEGEELAILIPDSEARSVELWVDGNDAPLIRPGRKVRLQFEGWPAVQFVGWPSVAVGTFGGEVALVDAMSRNDGDFRILVVPDKNEEPWPSSRALRQGARSKGWVLLDEVRLGYELWRQFNGFPATVSAPTGDTKAGKKNK